MENSLFDNTKCDGPGTFFYFSNIMDVSINITNNVFIKSFSPTFFIHQENCHNFHMNRNIFENNRGNLFHVENSYLNISNIVVKNESCNFEPGCIFNLAKLSFLSVFSSLFKNIFNENEGAIYYFENSEIMIRNEIIYNVSSLNYAGCMLGKNSSVTISNISAFNYGGGCIYLTESSLLLNLSTFHTNFWKIPSSEICYSSFCLINTLSIDIKGTVFTGNSMNTLYGGVSLSYKILIFFFFFVNKN